MLGLGFMGVTHLKAYRRVAGVEIAAVCSRDSVPLVQQSGNLDLAEEPLDLSDYRHCSDFQQVIQDPDIDAVDICLPSNLHAQVAIQALEAGKHVLVEKPMALDAASARAMIAAAEQANRVLMVGHVLRFFPAYQALREALHGVRACVAIFRRRSGAPGWSQWMRNFDESGGGAFDLLIHDVDFALHLFGAPQLLSATGYSSPGDCVDVITATWYYDSGLSVVITGGWHPKGYPFSMEYTVATSEGTIEYSSAGRVPTFFHRDGVVEPLGGSSGDGFAAELNYFAECVRDNRQPELCPPRESALAVAMARQMIDARGRRGERVPCEL